MSVMDIFAHASQILLNICPNQEIQQGLTNLLEYALASNLVSAAKYYYIRVFARYIRR